MLTKTKNEEQFLKLLFVFRLARIGGMPRPLFFLSRWPDEEVMIPVYAT